MRLQESGEMYLEAILVLSRKQGHVRSIDVSEYLGYSKPSVSRAVGLLKQGGYVVTDQDGFLQLIESGYEAAHKIFERHNVLSSLLIRMGVSKQTASEDACKIEHAISDATFLAMKNYLDTQIFKEKN